MSTRSKSKATRKDEILIPEKLYFRIGEVSTLCRLPAYVLRFWETEFPQLKPVKSSTGQRMYRRKEVETVLRIKQLLYEEGFTIAGARQQLRIESKAQTPLPFPSHSSGDLKRLRHGLEEILTMLSARGWGFPKSSQRSAHVSILEQANPRDTCSSGLQTWFVIFKVNASKGEYGNSVRTGGVQFREANSLCSSLSKHRTEDDKISSSKSRGDYFLLGVTGNRDDGFWTSAGSAPYPSHIRGRYVARSEMNAIGAGRKRDVHTRVDQDASPDAHFTNPPHYDPSEFFQFSWREVFLAHLDVVDSGASGLDGSFDD
jgi:DNA-binding transcriptional MerR regulator